MAFGGSRPLCRGDAVWRWGRAPPPRLWSARGRRLWPSTRPKPLYSKVRPSSVLFVELPTKGRLEAGRRFDQRHPGEGDERHRGAGEHELAETAPRRARCTHQVGEGDRRHREVGGQRLGVEGQPDQHAAPHAACASVLFRTPGSPPRRPSRAAGSAAGRRRSRARPRRTRETPPASARSAKAAAVPRRREMIR